MSIYIYNMSIKKYVYVLHNRGEIWKNLCKYHVSNKEIFFD